MPRAATGKLRPHDPFDLIRWLARSQPDPRKALAELVQNSLDAGARRVTLTRYRRRGRLCLSIRDDGEGVLPALPRREALEYIATHVGHSVKRGLSPEQRRELMALGQYGVGILGFWAIGREFVLRSKVGPAPSHALTLHEDEPRYRISEEAAGELDLEERWTEVLVRDLHAEAGRRLTGSRIAAFLREELRGQLLARGTEIRVLDRVARGLAEKESLVRPEPFRGIRVPELGSVPVPGYHPAAVAVHVLPAGEAEPGRVRLACAGALVADDLALVPALDLKRPPWTSGRFDGVVDFPDLAVPPGSRREVVADDAAAALRGVLVAAVEPVLAALLSREERERRERLEADIWRDLRRVARELIREMPHYEVFEVEAPVRPPAMVHPARPAPVGDPIGQAGPPVAGAPAAGESAAPEAPEESRLFPPGPLAAVRILPGRIELPPGGRRTVRARAEDADGRPLAGGVLYSWSATGVTVATVTAPAASAP